MPNTPEKPDRVDDLAPQAAGEHEIEAGEADAVRGGDGTLERKAGKGQQDYLVIKMSDVLISG